MGTLYELSEAIRNFKFEIDEETGEITNIDELNDIKMEFNEKNENIIRYIKNLDAESEAIRNEEKALAERRKSKENKIEWLKKYLAATMEINGKDKLEYTSGVASFRKSKAVEVDNEFVKWALLNNENQYLTMKEPTPNKTEIKNAITNGLEIPFARIIENKNLGIK